MTRLSQFFIAALCCATFSTATAADKSSGARIAHDDDSSETTAFRTVPVKQLDTCLGQYVRLHFPGDKVREGKLVSCDAGWVVLEQRLGSSTSTVRLVEKHIDKVELLTDASQPVRRAGTISFVDQSEAVRMSEVFPSTPSVTVIGRTTKAPPNCRLAR
jgi:hypothetical protein